MKLEIVFQNENFVVLDKPAMVLTTPSREGARDERECLGLALQNQMGEQIFPVHRLDFEVSGLVMFARNAKAHAIANAWFEHKSVFKVYQAFTSDQNFDHIPANVKNDRKALSLNSGDRFLWKSRLLRGKRRAYDHATGKPSETEAIYLGPVAAAAGEGGKPASSEWLRWELHPLTGRPHQLRYELSSHGFPIVGDDLYGSKLKFPKPGIALRAVKIDFTKSPDAKKLGLPATIEVGPL
ncbi:MAG: RNA pseudouridine synthase [Bdellovibrionales bacterium]|nr:RNA pseudouridine synthase [Bdellovibrionales bacterium]